MSSTGLPPLALLVVLASALLHATWNVLLARVPRGLDVTAAALVLGQLAWTPLALWRWHVDAGVWPYAVASAALELAYFVALNAAYARVPAHAAYPVARGLAPALLLPLVALTGAGVPALAGVGVGVISAGVLVTAWGEVNRRAVAVAIPVAVCIAGYTYVDGRGVHHADPVVYLWLVMFPVCVGLLIWRLGAGRGAAALTAQVKLSTVVVGIGLYGAYGLTLVALALVPIGQVPVVAALRESSILFVLALSWLGLGRTGSRPSRATAVGAALVFGGVVTLALT